MPLPGERPEPKGRSGLVHGGQFFGKVLVKTVLRDTQQPLTSYFAHHGFRRSSTPSRLFGLARSLTRHTPGAVTGEPHGPRRIGQ